MNSQIESPQTQTTSLFSPTSFEKEKKKVAENPVKLVFYTDTDTSTEYPIYVTKSREIWIKKKPSQPVATFIVKATDIYGDVVPVRNDDELKKVLSDAKADEKVAELVKIALAALRTLSSFATFARVFEMKYEVYSGDYAEYLGEATVYAIRLSAISKFSANDEKQAWAIAFSSAKRITAKFPTIAEYVYSDVGYFHTVTDTSINVLRRRNYPHAIVRVKIPVVTPEFEQLFNRALATTTVTTTTADIEKQIAELERLIEQKKAELRALEEQLQSLRAKLQLEKLKTALLG